MEYILYDDVLSKELLNNIIENVDKKNLNEGKVGNRINYNQKIRYDLYITDKNLLSEIDNTIYNRFYKEIMNKFNQNIQYRESWKVGKYTADKKGFYNYHKDDTSETRYRKISCVLGLSNPEDYEGGELHLKDLDIKIKLKKNSMIFFKSSLLHGVSPVTKGNRYVLIGFMFDNDGMILKQKIKNVFKPIKDYTPILKNNILEYYYQINNYNLDKDYADYYKNIIWSDQDDYYFQDNNNDKILLISFAGMGNKESIPTFNFYNFLKKYNNIDKLFIRDLQQRYYMTGLKNNTNNFHDTIKLLKKLTSVKKYKKIVALGCSSGGFAAILYSLLLNFDKVLAFSPQTVLNDKKKTLIKDIYNAPNTTDWLTNLKKYKDDTLYQKSLDLANFKPFNTMIEIHYGLRANKGIDKNHALYLSDDEKCKLVEHESNNHRIALELRDNNKLESIIERLLN